MLKRDSIGFGLFIGILLPAILFLILYFIGTVTSATHYLARPFHGNKIILLSLVVNLVTLRIYLVNLKMDRTGRGILFATFLAGIGFFFFLKYI